MRHDAFLLYRVMMWELSKQKVFEFQEHWGQREQEMDSMGISFDYFALFTSRGLEEDKLDGTGTQVPQGHTQF